MTFLHKLARRLARLKATPLNAIRTEPIAPSATELFVSSQAVTVQRTEASVLPSVTEKTP